MVPFPAGPSSDAQPGADWTSRSGNTSIGGCANGNAPFAVALMASDAFDQSTDSEDTSKDVSCTIEEIFAKHDVAAKAQADALNDQKGRELVDPENRADRAKNRLDKGDEISVEGGSTRHRIAFDVPKIRMRRVSFDIPQTFMGDTKLEVPDGIKQCWMKAGPLKTKVPCGVHT